MRPDISTMLEDELNFGENIVWRGQPYKGFLLRKADIILIPLSLLLGGFFFFLGYTILTSDSCVYLFGIPFLLIGLYFPFGRFLVDITQRRRTYYALTNERVIIIFGLFIQNFEILELAELSDINVMENRRGQGTIIFGPIDSMSWMVYTGGSWPIRKLKALQSPIFEMIDNVRKVFNLIKRCQESL